MYISVKIYIYIYIMYICIYLYDDAAAADDDDDDDNPSEPLSPEPPKALYTLNPLWNPSKRPHRPWCLRTKGFPGLPRIGTADSARFKLGSSKRTSFRV